MKFSRIQLGVTLLIVGAAVGLAAGYGAWGWPTDWYKARNVNELSAGAENDLIRYGQKIVVETAQVIGPLAESPEMRFAGNKLACTNCHLNAGLQPFGAPFVSTFSTYPMMVSDTVETLGERLNGCMTRSMNGRALPPNGREAQALQAYIRYVGDGSPQGVRVPGMGLMPLPEPSETADKVRGQVAFGQICARCHGAEGQGQAKTPPGVGYSIPPLWGGDSFNAGAGMADVRLAAAFIRANMPRGIDWRQPQLTVQQAWDIAAFFTAQPRPPAPAGN